MASENTQQAKKLIVVVGATGNQGGSVARRFLQDPQYAVRGLTRNPESPASKELAALGAEMVKAELEDVESLKAAFKGANVIFSVTQYWQPYSRPDCRAKAKELGVSIRQYAGMVELQHGRNIADAAATVVDTLVPNGFLVSTLSHAGKCSNGRFTNLYHFDCKAEIFPDYVNEKYPELAAKMSCIHTGFFTTSHLILPDSYFKKVADNTFEMRFPMRPDRPTWHLDVNHDLGNFVYAVSKMPPGKAYMAGEQRTWPEWAAAWASVTGATITYKQVTREDMVNETPDKDVGLEVAIMFEYSDDPGYDGGMELLTVEDLRKAGFDCPMSTLEESFRRQDFAYVLNKPIASS